MSDHRLYIIMRTDLASMNPGKGMAQAAHAANKAANVCCTNKHFQEWEQQTDQSFGTTIVLDGGSHTNIEEVLKKVDNHTQLYCVVHDPTYPIVDGDATHLIPLDTCAWVFVAEHETELRDILNELPLHK